MSPEKARGAYEKAANVLEIRKRKLFAVEDLRIEVCGARLYTPREHSWAEPLPLLVYYHGGGFTIGSLDSHDAMCRMLSEDGDCLVLSVDYRLAPEHKFPTAAEDAWGALCWALENAASLGADPERIAVGGDSAGGTLTAACALRARDAGVALQLLIYPGTCANQDTESHRSYAHGYLLEKETIDWFFQQYLRGPVDHEDLRFAPLDGKGAAGQTPQEEGGADLRGVAEVWVCVAEYDPLHDEGVAYAARLQEAGVPVHLDRYAGMTHDFFKMGGYVEDAKQAHADAAAALRQAFTV